MVTVIQRVEHAVIIPPNIVTSAANTPVDVLPDRNNEVMPNYLERTIQNVGTADVIISIGSDVDPAAFHKVLQPYAEYDASASLDRISAQSTAALRVATCEKRRMPITQ